MNRAVLLPTKTNNSVWYLLKKVAFELYRSSLHRQKDSHIEGIDAKAETMVITLDDLGHPLEPGYNHWVAWNITPAECIPGGIARGSVIEKPIHIEQGIAYGKHCYRGPKPPFNWNHEYVFTLYTLDCKLEASEKSKKEDILKLAEGHILQKAELRGRYQRKHR